MEKKTLTSVTNSVMCNVSLLSLERTRSRLHDALPKRQASAIRSDGIDSHWTHRPQKGAQGVRCAFIQR